MLRLGCIAFGGPVAHLAHFQKEIIEKRKWISEESYAELIAFCQFLPGPASSQVGMCLGLLRGSIGGMLSAWFAFTMPSVILLFLAAIGVYHFSDQNISWLHGLLIAVVAIVADAIIKLGKKLCPDNTRLTFAIIAATVMLLFPGILSQLLVIVGGAIAGICCCKQASTASTQHTAIAVQHKKACAAFAIIVGLLAIAAPICMSQLSPNPEPQQIRPLDVYAHFNKTGSLVFGGGHVVLPMLQEDIVGNQWLNDDQFLAGYGLTQAVPGPIFTFSAYLGTAIATHSTTDCSPVTLCVLAVLGIFIPSFVFVTGLLPIWQRLQRFSLARQALLGINASVLGLLIAAFFEPVWSKAMAVEKPALALSFALVAWLLLSIWKWPAWAVVLLAAIGGQLTQL